MEPDILVFMPKNGDVTLKLIRQVVQEIDSSTSTRSSSFSSDFSERSGSSSTVGKASTSFEDKTGGDDGHGAPGADEGDLEENVFFFAPDPPVGDDSPSYPPPPRARRGSDASSRRDRSASPPASFWATLKRQQKEHGITNPIEEPVKVQVPPSRPKKTITIPQEVHCVVSSRHMMLASEHFEKLLSGDFDEARTLKSTGHVTISLDLDPDTLIILLQIIHGKTREVPRQVSLDLLRKLAVMVNDFGMLGSVEFFADTWIDHSKREGLPASYTEDVLSWLYVFFVFGRADEFKDMANLSQRECDESFDANAREIRLPARIINSIKQGRQDAIKTAVSVIHNLITKYMDGTTHCQVGMDDNMRFACDAMLLGSLMKGSRKIGIWPRPEAPFTGHKYKDLAKAIRGLKMLDVCGKSAGRKWSSYGGFEGNAHGLEDLIENELKAVEENLSSLELETFINESVDSWENFRSHFPTPPPAPKVEPKRQEAAVIKEQAVDPQEKMVALKAMVQEPETSRITRDQVEPPSRRESQIVQQSQEIMSRPRGSFGEADTKPTQREEIRRAQQSRERPVSMVEQPTPTTPKEDLRRSYMVQGHKARLVDDEADHPVQKPTEPVKKGFFADVKSNVLPEMVQQSPKDERFNPITKTPSPVASKDKVVYASIFEPPKTESPKITSKKSHHQLSTRDPSPPTSNFDFSIAKEHLQAKPEVKSPNSQTSNETIKSIHTVTSNSPKQVTRESITSNMNFRPQQNEEVKDTTSSNLNFRQPQKEEVKISTTNGTSSRQPQREEIKESITSSINFRQPQKVVAQGSITSNLNLRPQRKEEVKDSITSSIISRQPQREEVKESITSSINFRQPQKEEVTDLVIGGGGTTTEEESDIWIPPANQGYKARKGNKKRFAVNRF